MSLHEPNQQASYLEAEEPPKAGTEQNYKNRFSQASYKYQQKFEDGGQVEDNLASSTPPTEGLKHAPDEDKYAEDSKHHIHYSLRWLPIVTVDNFKLNLKQDHMNLSTQLQHHCTTA